KIKTYLAWMNTPRFGVAGQMHDFGGIKEGFGGHATAQDAQAADIVATFDNHGLKPGGGGGAGSGVTGAAAADDCQVKLVRMGLGHSGRICDGTVDGKRHET